ncbi:MAG: aldehyde dehydrogenase [Bacilli bacterium]|nr:aldehyde dehydrogenase [Bacilli bacterium]
MADILTEAGLPNGYLNVVNGFGHETGQYLLEDDRIAMYTFTGSPQVGQQIKNSTGIRKITLGLGNNSPNIVHKDVADLDRAVELCVTRGFLNADQACISVQRIYVHQEIYDLFVEKAATVTKSLKVGNPADPDTDIGPMISLKEAQRAEQWILEAQNAGARVVCGGQRRDAVLYPTILVDVKPEMRVVGEEVFAPVIAIVPFGDINEAFRMANDTRFGLQVGLFTSDIQLALRAAQELEFGGVGREGPRYAIEEMTNERIVVFNL